MECKLISRYSPLFVLFLASLVNAQTGTCPLLLNVTLIPRKPIELQNTRTHKTHKQSYTYNFFPLTAARFISGEKSR